MSGQVLLHGKPTTEKLHRRARNGLSYITEERSVFKAMTTRDNFRCGGVDPDAAVELFPELQSRMDTRAGLLSGGEQALTALSLIFAVFRCHPAPVCVLDEVDAPLDDANVERLCDLLDGMAAEGANGRGGTRFLIVTHHPLTMARMHRLYGVTMQERGVSRLLSVDLGQAVELAESGGPPAGGGR